MLKNKFDIIKPFCKKDQNEFDFILLKIRYISFALIAFDFLMLFISAMRVGSVIFTSPSYYYLVLYGIQFICLISILLFCGKLLKSSSSHMKEISLLQILFSAFLLIWCAGISLLEQTSSGQIIVYTASMITIGAMLDLKPKTSLIIYVSVHTLFLCLLPLFQESEVLCYSHIINSTAFLIVSYSISYIGYKKNTEEFSNKKLLQEKSEELLRLNKELEYMNHRLDILAQTDSLTGVYNRLGLDNKLKELWIKCKNGLIPLSLIIIDIDFFKGINDTLGHQAGDDCIKQVASILSASIKEPSSVIARFGGDEFAILLPDTDRESSAEVAEQLRQSIEIAAIPHNHSSVSKYVTISLGVSCVIPTDKKSLNEFISNGDKALYQAKKQRNNTFVT